MIDWNEAKKELMTLTSISLKCDDYLITLKLVKISDLKFGIMVYVNGWFKGKWLLNDCEERRRFCREDKRYVYPRSERIRLAKKSKVLMKKIVFDFNMKISIFRPYWNSFEALKNHLIKNNKNIKVTADNLETRIDLKTDN